MLKAIVIFKVTLLCLFYVVYEIDPKTHLDCRRATRNIERKLLPGKEAGGVVQEEGTGLKSALPVNGMENMLHLTIPGWDHWQTSSPL